MNNSNKSLSNLRILILLDKIQFTCEKVIASSGLILVTLILAVSRVNDTITGTPVLWASELSQYIMIWTVFFGASLLMRLTEHVKLDFVLKALSKKIELYMEMFIYLIAGIFLIYFTYVGWTVTWDVYTSGQTMTNIQLSMGWAYLGFPLGTLLMAINAFKILILKLREANKLKRGEKQ